jgi:hypothetical protein
MDKIIVAIDGPSGPVKAPPQGYLLRNLIIYTLTAEQCTGQLHLKFRKGI